MKIGIDKQKVMQGAKVAAAVGAGAIVGQVGSGLAKRIGAVSSFAAKSELNEAIVDAASGLLFAGVVAMLLKGKGSRLAPFLAGGAILGAAAPLTARVGKAVDDMISKPGGGLFGSSNARMYALPKAGGGLEFGGGSLDVIPGGMQLMNAGDLF